LIVADSSYIVDALLSGQKDFGKEPTIVPELAVYEVVNAILVRERVLRNLDHGLAYVKAFFEILDSSLLEVVGTSGDLMSEAYEIGSRQGEAIYDCVFVALALRTGSQLLTRDRRQLDVMEREKARRHGVRHDTTLRSDQTP